MTVSDLASRLGVSRGLVGRMERGEAGTAIGTVFEAAAILGISLFEADRPTLEMHLATTRKVLTLLPRTARRTRVFDDF